MFGLLDLSPRGAFPEKGDKVQSSLGGGALKLGEVSTEIRDQHH